ncbi:hypothetical protein Misp02_32690 [Microtetraspora sp. NBRC 16547]|nr:hypothetical protein Misp02_32690 [Microtetraspora sp. NBRC 16547]
MIAHRMGALTMAKRLFVDGRGGESEDWVLAVVVALRRWSPSTAAGSPCAPVGRLGSSPPAAEPFRLVLMTGIRCQAARRTAIVRGYRARLGRGADE